MKKCYVRLLAVLMCALLFAALLPTAFASVSVPSAFSLGVKEKSSYTKDEMLDIFALAYQEGYTKGIEDAAGGETTITKETRTVDYVLNTNTHKFHYPDCSSVSDMAAKNRLDFSGSRDEVIAMEYVPCKRCRP